jgi:hypothetical protein
VIERAIGVAIFIASKEKTHPTIVDGCGTLRAAFLGMSVSGRRRVLSPIK